MYLPTSDASMTSGSLASASRDERNLAQSGEAVGAARATDFDDRVEPARKRTEELRVIRDAPDLATGRDQIAADLGPDVQEQSLHGVQIGDEAVTPVLALLVQDLGAQDRAVRAEQAHTALLQSGHVTTDACRKLFVRAEARQRGRPTLGAGVFGARLFERGFVFEAQASEELLGRVCVAHERTRPGFTERGIVVRHQAFGIVEVLPQAFGQTARQETPDRVRRPPQRPR